MERRDNRLGYIAVALGVAALALALSGPAGRPPVVLPAMAQEHVERVVPAPPAAPAQPAAPAPPARDPLSPRPEPSLRHGPSMAPAPPEAPAAPVPPIAPMFHDHVFVHGGGGPFALPGGLGRSLVALLLIVCGIRMVGGRPGSSELPSTGRTTRL